LLRQDYHDLLTNSLIISKAYKSLRNDFNKLSKDHKELQKVYEAKVDNSLEETIQKCNAYETVKLEETKIYLENE